MTFSHAKPIWLSTQGAPDEFAEFVVTFTYAPEQGTPHIRISADSDYNIYRDGELLAFGQYPDYPQEKIYDEIALPGLLPGENRLNIVVWYYGKDSQTYIKASAGLIYEVFARDDRGEEHLLAASGPDTPSRLYPAYISHREELITGQLGLTYHADACAETGETVSPYTSSRIVEDFPAVFFPRPIRKTVLEPLKNGRITGQGSFTYRPGEKDAARAMQTAALTHRPWNEYRKASPSRSLDDNSVTFREPDGQCYCIVDLGEETVGFLCFDIEIPHDCDIEIGYGEHLIDGRCRTSVRHFCVTYRAKAGRNTFLGSFRRLGGRYLQMFVHADTVCVHRFGLCPVAYPLTYKHYESGNLLRDTIYAVCQHTLSSCMHDHYEDCPWREQALYTMDSRNQMLCGYYAFGEQTFARASLHLIGHGMRPDGILSLCYPAGLDFPIPAFSLVYFIQMWEYIEHTGDTTLAAEYEPLLRRLMDTFLQKKQSNGLIGNFYGPGGYWNFYEWSPTMSGRFSEQEPSLEAPLNAFLSLALCHMAKIMTALGHEKDAQSYLAVQKEVNRALAKVFYEPETHLFASFDNKAKGTYSVLTNALCLLCGAAQGLDTAVIRDILENNGPGKTGLQVVPNTLSMNGFRFDALLAVDRDRYRDLILAEIDRTYLSMLRDGATTFYETIKGAADFSDAGSLCHGWSALPIYYYETLGKTKNGQA